MNWSNNFFNNISRNFFLKTTVEADIIEFFKSLGVSYTSQVIEQCCGEGQLQIALAKSLGCKSLGLDQCALYIETAKNLAKEAEVTSKFMEYDILNGKCVGLGHFVINWNTSWGYFEDDALNLKFLKNAYMHTRKDGTFVLEYYNSDFVKTNFETFRTTERKVDGKIYICERTSDIVNGCLISDCIIMDSNKEVVFNSSGLTKMYSKDQIVDMLNAVGFTNIMCYADLAKNESTLDSPRLIFVSKK